MPTVSLKNLSEEENQMSEMRYGGSVSRLGKPHAAHVLT